MKRKASTHNKARLFKILKTQIRFKPVTCSFMVQKKLFRTRKPDLVNAVTSVMDLEEHWRTIVNLVHTVVFSGNSAALSISKLQELCSAVAEFLFAFARELHFPQPG